ncbi:Activator of 90 kDa heat shock protein ATPase homolog 1 [Galdieria sulphuraria]|nr:Activator of 90 kDa heat shock protein ATPase homolog 1 [Galdieria sulphuraria]
MALRGQGDKRWIVEEREDGTNVNHWHWNEYDVSSWAAKRLKEMLSGSSCPLVSPWYFRINSTEQVHGEATVYAKCSEDEECVQGTFSIELLSGEPEISLTATTGDRQKWETSNWEVEAKNWLRQVLVDFIEQLGAGADLSISKNRNMSEDEVVVGQPRAQSNDNTIRNQAETIVQPKVEEESSVLASKDHVHDQLSSRGVAIKKLELWDKFRASPKDLYDCFVLAPKIQAYTRQHAEISPQVNCAFSLLQGQITGTIVSLEPEKRIVQEWRMKDWPSGHYSRVTIELQSKAEEGLTRLHLIQESVPEDYAQQTEQGWRQHIFLPIKVVFGYAPEIPF